MRLTLERMLAAAEEGLIHLPTYKDKWSLSASDVLDAIEQMRSLGWLNNVSVVPDSLVSAGKWLSRELKHGSRLWKRVKVKGMYYYRIERYASRANPNYKPTIRNQHQITMVESGGTRKILVISDLHIPYTLWDRLYSTLRDLQYAYDTLVINGDFLDVGSVSSFGLERDVPLLDEYLQAIDFLDNIKSWFSNIYLIRGNHEKRTKTAMIKEPKISRMSFMLNVELLSNLAHGIVYNSYGEVVETKPFTNIIYAKYGLKIGD
ncbi:MAG: metallophosphoesterase, partial [Armatimonadetes bacterium]|nr:metallophosphoesterase [Armatimonadota bacterium]